MALALGDRLLEAEINPLFVLPRGQGVVAADELLPTAVGWAAELGNSAGTALALSKSILDQTFELTAEQAFALGAQAQAICYTTDEHHAAVAAFLNRPR
jgi:1,4-dihydroxy-2-naphthoyl-CoA synthase